MNNLLNLINEKHNRETEYENYILDIFKDNLLNDKFITTMDIFNADIVNIGSFRLCENFEKQGYVCSYNHNHKIITIDFQKTLIKQLNNLNNIQDIKEILNKIPNHQIYLNVDCSLKNN